MRGNTTLTLQENPEIEIWLNPVGGSRTLSVPDGFVNPGTLRLESLESRTATLNVSGTFINEGTFIARPGGGGSRNFNGSLTNRGTVRAAEGITFSIGQSGATHLNEGLFAVENASLSFSGTSFENASTGLITGIGNIHLGGILLQNHGVLAPGMPNAIGTLTFTGSASFSETARTRIRLGGSEVLPESDRIHFSNTVALSGEFTLQNNEIFPELDTNIDPLTYGGRSGEFSLLTGTVLPGGLAFSFDYQADRLRLTAEEGDDTGPSIVDEHFAANAVRLRYFDAFGIEPTSAAAPANHLLERTDGSGWMPVPGLLLGISYDPTSRWSTISLQDPLPTGSYRLTVSGVRNLLGTEMEEPYTVIFQPEDVLDGIRTWHGGTGSDWHDPQNWFGRRVPGEDERAVIPFGNTPVILSQNATLRGLTAASPIVLQNGTLLVTEGPSTLSQGLVIERQAGLHAAGAGTAVSVVGTTAFNGGELRATTGARISLPTLPTLATGSPSWNSRNRIEADGTGSRIELPAVTSFTGGSITFQINALSGGTVLLDHLETFEGHLTARSHGTDSMLYFPRLQTMSSPGTNSRIEVFDTGEVEIGTMRSATTLHRVFLELRNAGRIRTNHLTVEAPGEVTGTGLVDGNLVLDRLELARTNSASPPDVLSVTGNLTFRPGAQTRFRAYSTGVPRIEVGGVAQLAGAFTFQNVNLSPALTDSHPLIEATVLSGAFTDWAGLNLGGAIEYNPVYTAAMLRLEGVAAVLPEVVEVTPVNAVDRFSTFIVTFNKALTNTTVGRGDFILTTPLGNLEAAAVVRVAPERYRVTFAEQEAVGEYTLAIGPAIADAVGNTMAAPYAHPIAIAKPPLPDLVVEGVGGPLHIAAGGSVDLTWTVANRGTAPLTGTWTETVRIESTSPNGLSVVLETLLFEEYTLAVDGTAPRALTLSLPMGVPHGTVRFVVEADSRGTVQELFTANNSAVSSERHLAPALFLTGDVLSIKETASANTLRPTLTRTGSLNTPLTVGLASSDPAEADVPAAVTFPTGRRSIRFSVTPVHDGIVDGDQPVTLSAEATGYLPADLNITVIDTDRPALLVELDREALVDGESTGGRVFSNYSPTAPLSVSLFSSRPGRLALPPALILPAGESEVHFSLTATESSAMRGDVDVTIGAEAQGYTRGESSVFVVDPKTPTLSMELRDPTIRTGAITQGTVLTVRRAGGPLVPMDVHIVNTRSDLVQIASTVHFPAGAATATTPVSVRPGAVVAAITEVALNARLGPADTPFAESDMIWLNVVSEQTPHLSAQFSPNVAQPGMTTASILTLTRNPVEATPLTVALTSSHPDRVEHAAEVIIPANTASVDVPVGTFPQTVVEGPREVTFTAAAEDHLGVSTNLLITATALPDLAVLEVTAPALGLSDGPATIGYRIINQGTAATERSFHQRVFITNDPSRPFQYLLAQHTFTGILAPNQVIERDLPILLPRLEGDFHVFVQTDATNRIEELLEDNNLGYAPHPIVVNAGYTATVTAGFASAPAGTPVPLSGTATFAATGDPAPNVPVRVIIRRGGFERTVEFVTDATGAFAGEWRPLAKEAGSYEAGAAHPGVAEVPMQTAFRLLGLRAQSSSISLRLTEGGPSKAVQIVLENPANVPAGGLAGALANGGGPVSADFHYPAGTTLPADGTLLVEVEFTPSASGTGTGNDALLFTTADGSTVTVPVAFQVIRPTAKLVAAPTRLSAAVVRERAFSTQITVTNEGGGASGPLEILASDLAWLSLPARSLPPLAPGDSASFTVRAHPPIDIPLSSFEGELIVRESNGPALTRVPFALRVLSDASAALRVTVENEFTYFAEGAPRLEGATVRLSDYFSGDLAATGVSGPDGSVDLMGLVEGYYLLEVSAANHHAYAETLFVPAGPDNTVTTLLNYESVRYIWEVVEVEYEDRYEIIITTEFETQVPKPVVTIEPAFVDLIELLRERESVQIDYAVTNHGFITAKDAALEFSNLPGYTTDVLIPDIGDIPALTTLTVPVIYTRESGLTPQGTAGLNASHNATVSPQSTSPTAGCIETQRVVYHYECGLTQMREVARTMTRYEGCPPRERPRVPRRTTDAASGSVRTGDNNRAIINGTGISNALGWLFAEMGFTGGGAPREVTPRDIVAPPRDNRPCANFINDPFPPCIGLLGWPLIGPIQTAIAVNNCLLVGHLNACIGLLPLPPATGCALDLLGETGWVPDIYVPPGIGLPPFAFSAFAGGTLSPSGDPSPYALLSEFPSQSGDALRDYLDRVLVMEVFKAYLLGSYLVRTRDSGSDYLNWMRVFEAAVAEDGPGGGAITLAEHSALLDMSLPEGVDEAEANRVIDRWNRTLDYHAAGILNVADVPSGMSTDFIAMDEFNMVSANAAAVIADSEADGFAHPLEGFLFSLQLYLEDRSDSVCATVKLQIRQEAVLARTAFEARLTMENDGGDPLEDVYVEVSIFNSAGQRVNDLFGIQALHGETLSGLSSNSLAPAASASGEWRIVPSLDAAPTDEPIVYGVGGAIHYTQNGRRVSIPFDPTEITVYPQPELVLNYYHERDVFANDPFTPVVEPSIPFSLGVLVSNRGFGTARSLTIISGQPEIIENDKGLAIDFEIIGVETDGAFVENSLTARFGELAPGETKSAIWWLTSSLHGKFIGYDATFAHLDGFGDLRLSLIQEVAIHETLGRVRDVRAGAGGRSGFLVSDRFPVAPRPLEIHWQDGGHEPIAFVGNPSLGAPPSPQQTTVFVNLTAPDGWFLSRFEDPSGGALDLVAVVRADGRELLVGENVRVTDRTFRSVGRSPVREHIIHLVDHGGPGQYTLVYAPDRFDDTTPPVASVSALPEENYERFVVEWAAIDAGGIASFEVYVSVDGAPATLWLGPTNARAGVFDGELGRSYAFYVVARDLAGNANPLPAEPHATTTVSLQNQPPAIIHIPDQTISERQNFVLQVEANDPDAPAQSLRFVLAGGAPPGMAINADTGRITWLTNENDGGGVWDITVRVTDDGWPPLTDETTFRLTVLEVNHAPVVLPIGMRQVFQDETIAFVVSASDTDIPANNIAFSLDPGAPLGATIHAGSGLFTWAPDREMPLGTYSLAVRAMDDGAPPLSGTGTFSIEVLPFRVDLAIGLGATGLSWTEGDSPLALAADAEVTVGEPLDFNGGRLTAIITGGGSAGDRIGLASGPSGEGLYQIDESGNVLRNGELLGLLSLGWPQTSQTLRIDLLATSDPASLQELLRLLTYTNTERHPPANDRIITLALSDSMGREATAVQTVDVTPVNTPPVVTALPLYATTEGRAVVLPWSDLLGAASDPEGDPLSLAFPFSASDSGAAITPESGRIRYAPPVGLSGWDTLRFHVNDLYGGQIEGTARIWVRAYNAPSAIAVANDETAGIDIVGVPGLRYHIEWRSDGGPWQALDTVYLPEAGSVRLPAPSGSDPATLELRVQRLGGPVLRIPESHPRRIQVFGIVGEPFDLRVSEDLTEWQTLEEGILGPHDVLEWADPEPTAHRRFFIFGQ